MAAQAALARRQLGSWLAPGALFSIGWAGLVIGTLVAAPDYRIWPGVLWFLLMTSTAHLGGLLAQGVLRHIGALRPARPALAAEFRYRMPLIVLSSVLGMLGLVVLVASQGKGPLALFSPTQIAKLAPAFTGARYTDPDYEEPAAFLLLSVLLYFAAYLSGTLWAETRSWRRRLVALLPLFVVTLETMVLGASTAFMGLLINWVAAYLAARLCLGKVDFVVVSLRNLLGGLLALCLFTGFYLLVHLIRMDAFQFVDADRPPVSSRFLLAVARNQYVGHVSAFSGWLANHWDAWETPGLGRYDFAGPVGWLGVRVTRSPEAIHVSADPDEPVTNVYGLFRPLALDWTLPGSALVLLLLTLLASLAYAVVRGGRPRAIPLLVWYYQMAVYVTGPPFTQTVFDGGLVLFGLYCLFAVSGNATGAAVNGCGEAPHPPA
jgi:hypothetical protein